MEKSGGSRLLQMQARFQQKQMQEREMKIASLYEAQQARALDRVRQSPGSGSASVASAASPPQPPAISHHPGKVRQMFEERRTKAGIDKSYPLQPIHNTDRLTKKALPNGHSKVTAVSSRTSVERKTTKAHTTTHSVRKQQHKIGNVVNGSGDLNHNHEQDLNNKYVLPRSNGEVASHMDEVDRADNNYLLENETFPDALEPTPTPRSPEPEPKKPQRRSPATKSITPKAKPQSTPIAPPRRVTSETTATDSSKPRGAMQRTASNTIPPKQRQATQSPVASKPRATAGAASAEGGCAVCGRRFAPDRLDKHQDICRKAHAKKRKPFDVVKHRLAEPLSSPLGSYRSPVLPSALATDTRDTAPPH
ncbi:hypothetical protein ACJJTC_015827 [Scirpophaga incertulas]